MNSDFELTMQEEDFLKEEERIFIEDRRMALHNVKASYWNRLPKDSKPDYKGKRLSRRCTELTRKYEKLQRAAHNPNTGTANQLLRAHRKALRIAVQTSGY